jgi:hypothetical protein
VPYGNGRNEESSSEAVNGYDGVTLYGHQMAQVFAARGDMARANTASHIRYSTHTLHFVANMHTHYIGMKQWCHVLVRSIHTAIANLMKLRLYARHCVLLQCNQRLQ